MNGTEPLLLYPGTSSRYAMLSWSETGSRSYFFALGSEDGRKDLSRKIRRSSDKAALVERQLQTAGGILVSVNEEQGQSYRLAIKAWASPTYSPPEQLMVFGPGENVEAHSIGEPQLLLAPAQCALVPVDRGCQDELQATVTHLRGLPPDLRAGMLRTLAGHAALPAQGPVHGPVSLATPASAERSTTWVWIVLASIVGILAGAAGSFGYAAFLSAQAHARREREAHVAAIADPLAKLILAIPNSKDDRVQTLNDIYLAPLARDPQQSQAKGTAEAWMLAKLALYKSDPQTDTSWTKKANDSAIEKIRTSHSIDAGDLKAVQAVACLQDPPVSVVNLEDCAHVDWNAAARSLAALTNYVITAPKPQSPDLGAQPDGITPLPKQTGLPKTGSTSAASPVVGDKGAKSLPAQPVTPPVDAKHHDEKNQKKK